MLHVKTCVICVYYVTDGNYLAIGSKSGYIVVYSTVDGGLTYCRVGKCQVCICRQW